MRAADALLKQAETTILQKCARTDSLHLDTFAFAGGS